MKPQQIDLQHRILTITYSSRAHVHVGANLSAHVQAARNTKQVLTQHGYETCKPGLPALLVVALCHRL